MSAFILTLRLFLQILTMDEVSKIGKISKQWTGLLREAFTDSDNFGIQFPMDLDVRMKAVMIGACFLIVSKVIRIFMCFKLFVKHNTITCTFQYISFAGFSHS